MNNQFDNREEMLAETHEQLKHRTENLQRELIESQTNVDLKDAELTESRNEIKELKNEIYELMVKVHEKEKLMGAVNEEYSTIQG